MRYTLWALLFVGFIVAVLAIPHGQTATSAAPSAVADLAASIPDSMVGRSVHVYFRGSDNLPWPAGPGVDNAPGHLLDLAGRVVEVRPGWIVLGGQDNKPCYWIASRTVAFVGDDQALLPAPTP